MTLPLSLVRDRRGVTAVEFALLATPLLWMICGTIEIGHTMFARAALEGAVVEAARTATASLESSETARDAAMRQSITDMMGQFRTAPGTAVTITTTVYRDFASVTPENFTDKNGNGSWDAGEDFIDRNGNGKWDPAIPVAGTMGGPGDVVAYTATFPKQMLFGSLTTWFGVGSSTTLSATTVVRNEAVLRKQT